MNLVVLIQGVVAVGSIPITISLLASGLPDLIIVQYIVAVAISAMAWVWPMASVHEAKPAVRPQVKPTLTIVRPARKSNERDEKTDLPLAA